MEKRPFDEASRKASSAREQERLDKRSNEPSTASNQRGAETVDSQADDVFDEVIDPANRFDQAQGSFDTGADVRAETLRANAGGRRMGGATGGDFLGGGAGPDIGQTHPGEEDTAEHFGSREETQQALEQKIAINNTRTLRDEH
jgi:hypothetical protein